MTVPRELELALAQAKGGIVSVRVDLLQTVVEFLDAILEWETMTVSTPTEEERLRVDRRYDRAREAFVEASREYDGV